MSEPKLTRCPGCGTVFRVTAVQLSLREGQVRCGHCRAVFDANDHFVSLEIQEAAEFTADDELMRGRPTVTLRSADALLPAPDTPPRPDDIRARGDAPTLPEEPTAGRNADETPAAPPSASPSFVESPAQQSSSREALFATAERPGGSDGIAEAFAGEEAAGAGAAGEGAAGEGAAGEGAAGEGAAGAGAAGTATAAAGAAGAGAAGAGAAGEGAAGEGAAGEGAAGEGAAGEGAAAAGAAGEGAAGEGAAGEGAAAAGAAAAGAAAAGGSGEGTGELDAVAGNLSETTAPDASTIDGASAPMPAALAPIDVRDADRSPRFAWKKRKDRSAPSKPVYIVAIVALAIAIVLQVMLEFRDSLAAHVPATRGLLAGACRVLSCTLEPLKDTAALSIDASDLQADPAHRGLLILSATIRNRATHPIAYPYLELTLTDSAERVVVRRAFAPQDYAGGTADFHAGIAVNGERLIKLFIDASATQQAGYQLYLFYP